MPAAIIRGNGFRANWNQTPQDAWDKECTDAGIGIDIQSPLGPGNRHSACGPQRFELRRTVGGLDDTSDLDDRSAAIERKIESEQTEKT